MSTLQQNQAALFNFAHLARCAAAILRRADADIVRLTGVSLGAVTLDWLFTFAHRALCARAIRRRAASETLSEHPKAAIQEHLKSGHTFRRIDQDIDSSGRVSSLSQHECLEGRKETANHNLGTTGMVSAKDPRGHASASRDHQHLLEGGRSGSVAAGRVGSANRFKTGHGGDHRLWRGVEHPATGDPGADSGRVGKTGHRGDHRLWRAVERPTIRKS